MNDETEQEMPEARIADAGLDPVEVLKAEVEALRDQRLQGAGGGGEYPPPGRARAD